MKKILFLTNSHTLSGAEMIGLNLMRHLRNLGEYQFLYQIIGNGPIEETLQKEGFPYVSIPKMRSKELQKILDKEKPDIIHANDFRASIAASFCKFDGKLISHIHQNPTWLSSMHLKSLLYKWRMPAFDEIVLVSKAIQLESPLFRKQSNVNVIPNCVDRAMVLEKGKEKIQDTYDIMYCGRLKPEKNPLEFLDILSGVKKQIPNLKACMVGSGYLEEACMEKIQDLSLQDTVEMKGFQKNPYAYMEASKVLVVPSWNEGFGLVAVEAMCLGKPVVARKVGGLKEMISSKNGILYETVESATKEVCTLLQDTTYYEQKSGEALKTALIYSDMDAWCQKFIEMYNR